MAATITFATAFQESLLMLTPEDDLDLFVVKHGPPDEDDTTTNDSPRPLLMTRWITYKKQGVRAMYRADGKIGDTPPLVRWKLIGFQDPATDAVLNVDEVQRRMAD